ncbi:MAG: hypothetical protein ACK4NY_22145 [Spirosomataceae bacterium]
MNKTPKTPQNFFSTEIIYKTPSGLGGKFTLDYVSFKEGKHIFRKKSNQFKFFLSYTDEDVLNHVILSVEENSGMPVNFKVVSIADKAKQGSNVLIGAILQGRLDSTCKRIYFTDNVDTDWIFYVNDTCTLI